MNICCSIDERFIEPFKTLCYSLAESQEEKINLYLIHDELSKKEIINIKKYLDFLKINFHEILFPSEIKKKLSYIKKERNIEPPIGLIYRLFIPILLPEDINRVLYLDSDIIVQKDISAFYYTDFLNKKIVGIIDPVTLFDYESMIRKRIREILGITKDYEYINSGVLLFNLKELRNIKSLNPREIYRIMWEKELTYLDQDIINCLLEDDILIFNQYNYNAPMGSFDKKDIPNFSILHYAGTEKPWILDENHLEIAELYPYIKRVKIVRLIENYLQRR